MYRFFVTPEQVSEEEIRIIGDDVNHIKNVLRMKPGEEVRISDGRELEYFGHVTALSEEAVLVGIDSREPFTTELPVEITLFQGLPKGDKMELIIQKAVELGACRIVPVAMKRCVMKLDEKKAGNKVKRWNAIAESAAKQSKRAVIPEVTMPLSYKDMLKNSQDFEWKLLPYESAEGMSGIRRVMKEMAEQVMGQEPGRAKHRIGILIGPEGGFDDGEISLAMDQGWKTISLGSRILRTETAGLATLSVLTFMLEP